MGENLTADQALAVAWGHFMRARLFEEALLLASLMKRYAASQPDQKLQAYAHDVFFKTVEELLEHQSGANDQRRGALSRECSFCGKTEPHVKLGAGRNSMICNECVTTFSQTFNATK